MQMAGLGSSQLHLEPTLRTDQDDGLARAGPGLAAGRTGRIDMVKTSRSVYTARCCPSHKGGFEKQSPLDTAATAAEGWVGCRYRPLLACSGRQRHIERGQRSRDEPSRAGPGRLVSPYTDNPILVSRTYRQTGRQTAASHTALKKNCGCRGIMEGGVMTDRWGW